MLRRRARCRPRSTVPCHPGALLSRCRWMLGTHSRQSRVDGSSTWSPQAAAVPVRRPAPPRPLARLPGGGPGVRSASSDRVWIETGIYVFRMNGPSSPASGASTPLPARPAVGSPASRRGRPAAYCARGVPSPAERRASQSRDSLARYRRCSLRAGATYCPSRSHDCWQDFPRDAVAASSRQRWSSVCPARRTLRRGTAVEAGSRHKLWRSVTSWALAHSTSWRRDSSRVTLCSSGRCHRGLATARRPPAPPSHRCWQMP
jgi:hypothetical protein